MLTINQLSVAYGKVPVLENLDLHLEPNRIHGIVGLNGSGKTTLFNAISGLVKQNRGSIAWNGKPVSRKDIALLETQNYFYSNITGREHLRLFPSNAGTFNLEIWEDLFRLPLDELIDNYSTGMKKKLALLGILKLNKPVLLLDEPFNGLDLEAGRVIKVLLQKLKERNKTVIVSSHILETLTNSCDFVHHLENRKIKKTYGKDELAALERDLFREMEDRVDGLIEKAL